jgi:hypothetical protein
MQLEIDYKKNFKSLYDLSATSDKKIDALLYGIGEKNAGLLVPYKKEVSEKYFISKIWEALNRQIVYYVNILSPKANSDFLGQDYVNWLVKKTPELLVDEKDIYARFDSRGIENFQSLNDQPDFENYVKFFLNKGISFAQFRFSNDLIVNELQSILIKLANEASGQLYSEFKTMFRHEKIKELTQKGGLYNSVFAVERSGRVSVLFDYYYFDVLIDQISKSKKSISILMFYFALDRRKKKAPTTLLFNSLVEASKRGVAVNVVLDRDKEGEKYFTREINKNAITSLKAKGINAKFDSVDSVVHSKVVVIDKTISFVGSHNFSISASYKYEELSLIIQNKKLGSYYEKYIASF